MRLPKSAVVLRNLLAKNDFKLTHYPWWLFSPDSTPPLFRRFSGLTSPTFGQIHRAPGWCWLYCRHCANIEDDELEDFRSLAKSYATLSEEQIATLQEGKDLMEICHGNKK